MTGVGHMTIYTIYMFLSYEDPLVPCCLDKLGYNTEIQMVTAIFAERLSVRLLIVQCSGRI